MQNILLEVERYKRQKCQDSDLDFCTRLRELQHEEDWEIKQKLTVVNGFWRETIFLWKKVSQGCVMLQFDCSLRLYYLHPSFSNTKPYACMHASMQPYGMHAMLKLLCRLHEAAACS